MDEIFETQTRIEQSLNNLNEFLSLLRTNRSEVEGQLEVILTLITPAMAVMLVTTAMTIPQFTSTMIIPITQPPLPEHIIVRW